jgi:hypothetical protein
LHFDDESITDLFVLGRNVYQTACGGAWSAAGFIKGFHGNEFIPLEAKCHILNGMAYEIYFNSHGILRTFFKTQQYLDVIGCMETDIFQNSKIFIASRLAQYPDNIIYVPGSETRIELHIASEFNEVGEGNDVIMHLTHVFYRGKDILYCPDLNGFSFDSYAFSDAIRLTNVRNELAKSLVAPPDMVLLTSNVLDTEHTYFKLPYGFTLRINIASDEEA